MRDLIEIAGLVCGMLFVSLLGVLVITTPYLLGAPAWTAFPMTPVTLTLMVFEMVRLDWPKV